MKEQILHAMARSKIEEARGLLASAWELTLDEELMDWLDSIGECLGFLLQEDYDTAARIMFSGDD